MNERVALKRLVILLGFLGSLIAVYVLPPESASPHLKVTFFDVGQGDATLIETPDGVQVLIDGGRDGTVVRKLSDELGFFDRTLDMVVGTHPDSDHIGGLNDVFRRYNVARVITSENTGESGAATEYLNFIKQFDGEVIYARRGQTYKLGASTTMEILFPDRDPSLLESNTASIILQIQYGETEFLFTGDAPKGVEDYLVIQDAPGLESEVLKIGHHGSDTSTSELFLNVVQPQYGVVSAGENNRYGHPHSEVSDRLAKKGVIELGTLGQGDVTFYSDGTSVWVADSEL